MLQVLLLILKIIGIILLVIIGLILLIALSVLFVPVRYSGKASYDDEVKCDIRFSWLLHILSFRICYEEVLTAKFRVFGFPVFKETLFGEEEEDSEPELESEIKETVVDTIKDIARIPKKTEKLAEDYAPEPENDKNITGSAPKANQKSNQKHKSESGKTEWLLKLPEKLWFSFQNFCDKLKGIQNFINDEANRATFSLLHRQVKRFLKHVLPGKIKGRIAFGFDDPYTTGQVLMYISPFLGWYHKHLSLEPYFDRSVLEGNVALKGRIRIATVLFLGFQVYRDRNFRKLWKKWRE